VAVPIQSVAVVGAGLAGANCITELRACDFNGTIHLIGAELHRPYNRPPLSKGSLLFADHELNVSSALDLKVDLSSVRLHLGTRATGLGERSVQTTHGPIEVDAVIIATGAEPIRLEGMGRQHVLRTRDDAMNLRELARNGSHLVVVGASWLGAEVASAAAQAGMQVSCVEASPVPLARSLGAIGGRTVDWWSHIDLRLGVQVREVIHAGVALDGQNELEADLVVSAVGCRPDIAWLSDTGIPTDQGGVVVDEHLQVVLPEDHAWSGRIAAVGDVSTWPSARYARRLRVEHWDNALQGPRTAVRALLGHGVAPFDPIPYFWSEQFGHRLQFAGVASPEDRVVVREHGDRWTALWLRADDSVAACLAVDAPQDVVQSRKLITAGAPIDMAKAQQPDIPLRDLAMVG